MKFRRDRTGFIFSLDSTLGILVVIIVIAGVARVGVPPLTHGQHGYLNLERFANDALEVLQSTGTIDSIVKYTRIGDLGIAENLARIELRGLLPLEIQFKMVVGSNRLTVYPSQAAGWGEAFSDSEELGVAIRMTTFPGENIRVLAWYDSPGDLDETFINRVGEYTGWEVKKTNDRNEFVYELWRESLGYYDAVFIPDAEIDLDPPGYSDGYVSSSLRQFSQLGPDGGRVVVGGRTLYFNYNAPGDGLLWDLLGVQFSVGVRPQEISGYPLNQMRIVDGESFLTSPYLFGENIEYNENYHQYVYTPLLTARVEGQWENTPEGVGSPLPGIIVNEGVYQPGVLFNMRLAQSAMDPSSPAATIDWVTLAKRALGYEDAFEPITLYLWRGREAG